MNQSLPSLNYEFKQSPSLDAVNLFKTATSFDCIEEDVRHCDTFLLENTLYMVYSILCPNVPTNGRWVPIQELFNEETEELVRRVVSKAISTI